ncbi:MAG: hypothetical protein ABW321_14330 [Polyangiales bacterium]
MQTEEPTPEYTGFLRSGQYPILSRKLVQCSGVVARVSGLAALALVASGAGYMLTQWLVPVRSAQAEVQVAEAALPLSLSRAHAMPAEIGLPGSYGAVELARTAGADLARPGSVLEHGEPPTREHPVHAAGATTNRAHASRKVQPTALRGLGDPPTTLRGVGGPGTGTDGAELGGPKAAEPKAPGVDAVDPLDTLVSDSERTAQIADRVRALEEQHAEDAPATGHGANAATSDAAPRPAIAHPAAPGPVASPAPTRVPALQLRAAATIEDLSVRGSLSASNVRRSVERLRPALAACYERAAQQAGRNGHGRVELSLTIDETGRARAPHVSGAALPGLGSCLSSVTSKLVSQAPDTGTVRASITVNFMP